MSYRQRTTEKAALFIVSTALWVIGIVLFLSGHFTVLRWFALGFAFIGYVGVFVADWQDELRLRRHIASERALSHERARIVGDYVHGTQQRGDRDA